MRPPEALAASERESSIGENPVKAWRVSILLLVVSYGVVLVSFRRTLEAMVQTWYGSRTYSHCFLIVPLSGFLVWVWVRRGRLSGLTPTVNHWGLPLIGLLAAVWMGGTLAEARVVQEFALVSILIALAWTIMGTGVIRAMAVPLFFLYFSVPFGTSLIKPLQEFTAWFVIHALTVSNVPAVMENHVISLPSGTWTVAAACSGIRFLLSSVVLGTLFCFLLFRSLWRRVIFLCASIVTPIVGNGLRAYGTVLLAYLTNNRLAAGIDHVVYGAAFSVFIQLLLIIVALRWQEKPVQANGAISERNSSNTKQSSTKLFTLCLAASAACVVILGASSTTSHLWNRAVQSTSWLDPPVAITSPWEETSGRDMSWLAQRQKADQEFARSYRSQGRLVDLDWAMYSGQHELELGGSPDGLPDSNSWVLANGGLATAVVNGQRMNVYTSTMRSGRVSRIVWTWYWVAGEFVADRAKLKLKLARARWKGESAGVIAISIGADEEIVGTGGELAMRDFLRHAFFTTANQTRETTRQTKVDPRSHKDGDSGTS